VTLAGMGKLDEAAEHLEAAARLDPPSPNALSRLGDLRMIQGRAGEAEKAYREALRIRPDDAQARMSLGAALARQREYEEAVTAFREAMTGDSRVEVTAFYQIARVRAAQGRNEDAVTALKKAVDKGFRNGAFLANDGDLAGLRDRADFKGLLEDLEKRQKAAGTGESTHETGSK
ncbi:MAG TPA: tetratricopeptide repeat protein, partial [Syntrophales bacterium]|nr:tetratricopeptide repeat protein [Syntrophales bacterium]